MTLEHSNMEQQIWEYVDNTATPEKRAYIKHMLETDSAWQQMFEEITAFNSTVQEHITTDEPSMRFTKAVMEQVSVLPTPTKLGRLVNPRVIRAFAAILILPLLGLVAYSLFNINWQASSKSVSHIPHVSMEVMWLLLGLNIILVVAAFEVSMRRKRQPVGDQ